jgi:hypothetical protein
MCGRRLDLHTPLRVAWFHGATTPLIAVIKRVSDPSTHKESDMSDLNWQFVHPGYYASDGFGGEYVVRTRPANDGWMAIACGSVIGEGLSLRAAQALCAEAEDAEIESQMESERSAWWLFQDVSPDGTQAISYSS